ncbi:helix-turn-helix transcriptional regulator [Amycolatopsis sp. NPDC059235]|uniref:helix-turn-helix domain-containing protein n=1 Tax=Amycolatopsis sp. NPDC059235 TaxID=3346782 RepID=UPI00366ECFD8
MSTRVTLLGAALRAARERASWGLNELARKIGVRPARLSGWELGLRAAPEIDVAYILGTLGVDGDDKRRILALARMTASEVVILGRHHDYDRYAMLADCGTTATSVADWNPLFIPDLVQNDDYARETLIAAGRTEAEVHFVGELGAEHRELIQSKPFTAYIGEAAFAHMTGSFATVSRQFGFLASLAAPISSVRVRVVPTGTDRNPGLMGPFTRYDTNSGPVVHLPSHGAAVFMPDDGNYSDVLEELDNVALSTTDSRALMDKYAAKHRVSLRRSA